MAPIPSPGSYRHPNIDGAEAAENRRGLVDGVGDPRGRRFKLTSPHLVTGVDWLRHGMAMPTPVPVSLSRDDCGSRNGGAG
jgi:Iap family predicted aminopeptidase